MAREDEERIVDNEEVSQPTEEDQVVSRDGRRDNELSLPSGGCCMPSSTGHRFMALVFMCLLGFGSYFCYDAPGALQNYFKRDLHLTSSQFTLIYSIYSWPNVVLCFLIFAAGGITGRLWMMILGRFIFGMGAESLAVAQNSYAVLWFKGKELNMVFGLQLSVARFGSTVNFWVMQPIYEYVSNFYQGHTALGVVLLLATLTCVMSMICALILGWMDKRAERILQRNNNPAGQIPKLTDVFSFKAPFWMVSIICVAYYVAIFPFIALGQNFFVDRFGLSPAEANTVDSLVYLIAAVSSPVFGFIIDKLGRNVTWVFTATLTTIGAHALLTFTQLTPYVGMIIMGLSYSMLAASLWPLVALIIPEYQLGTAYGFCQSIQNLGLAVITIVAGIIVDNSGGEHMWLQLFFMGWLTIALISTGVIWAYNNKHRGNLNMTPQQRAQFVSVENYQNFE
ncbi:GD13074 [Drosophila simulans]|uniref:Lysosomal dipeptide transporter MFSD1 n=1 Tax=Drosophila simulans TaxID=7240 RepID=B4QKC0_DROSI|nr:GD13074 [Drosophila simulans]